MNTTPLARDIWLGIGGHFDSFTQVICEFIDNSISNFEAANSPNKNIYISLNEIDNDMVSVVIEDNGTGIKDFEPVLRLGDKSVRETPLNEHGFGLKHALACADPANETWKICTRTAEDFKQNKFRQVSAPYRFNLEEDELISTNDPWEGIFNGSGSIVVFNCSKVLFDTIQSGIKGKAHFDKCLEYLKEELGYIYAGVIKNGKVIITIHSSSLEALLTVKAIEPDWKEFYKPGQGDLNLDLGEGQLLIQYQFGEMGESSHFKHYKRNMSTSGVEIRINGRLIMSNLFKEIWQLENHPSFNHFLVIINLVSPNRDSFPKTRTSKNGIRTGDDKLKKLLEWIKSTCPNPPKDLAGAVREKALVGMLKEAKEQHIRSKDKHIEDEFGVFKNIGSTVPVDLYVFDGKEILLYEAKKDTADVQSVYQLLMYWDGAVADGLSPDEGILIASEFSKGADIVIEYLNARTDAEGNKYKFVTKTWKEQGVPYPKS